MRHPVIDDPAETFRNARARTRRLFDLIRPEAYYERPIALRNPIVFYEGHLPAFSVNTLVKLTLGRKGIDEGLETLFARGIDPEDETAVRTPADVWPSREDVQAYGREADALVEETLRQTPAVEAAFTILEHELMHQETLLYLFHELDYQHKISSMHSVTVSSTGAPSLRMTIPAGEAQFGQQPGFFGWDNEFPAHTVAVPQFTIESHNVINGQYLEFLEATKAPPPHFWLLIDGQWWWRGMFALTPLMLDAPVYVTHAEASAYARWKGARLPTEAELDRATYGAASETEGNFDFQHWDPVPAGSYPPNGFGLYDLIGNGWEWTSTLFEPFPGFQAMRSYPEYSADFFDGAHYVMKGASPATARELVRRSFRNWFRPAYPYVYATFRCAW